MATTKATASAHVRLLLAAILLAVASVKARGDSMSPPSATAPPPASGGQCPPDKVAELRQCFESSPLGGIRLPRTLDGLRRCCRRVSADESIRGGGFGFVRPAPSPDAVACLCSAFSNSSDPANDVNNVLTICGEGQVPDLACSSSQSVTV